MWGLEHCLGGTPALTGRGNERVQLSHTLTTRGEEVSNSRVELALDSIGRQFGEQGMMPDCIKSSRYVQILSASTIVGRVEAACPR